MNVSLLMLKADKDWLKNVVMSVFPSKLKEQKS